MPDETFFVEPQPAEPYNLTPVEHLATISIGKVQDELHTLAAHKDPNAIYELAMKDFFNPNSGYEQRLSIINEAFNTLKEIDPHYIGLAILHRVAEKLKYNEEFFKTKKEIKFQDLGSDILGMECEKLELEEKTKQYVFWAGLKEQYFDGWVKQAMDRQPSAMCNVAECYERGIRGRINYEDSITYYDDNSEYYGEDIIPVRDIKAAIAWYEEAAKLDYIPALRKLGEIYSNDRVIERDFDKAVAMLDRAIELGDPESVKILAKLYNPYNRGVNEGANFSKSVELYEKAIELGYPEAVKDLVKLYSTQAMRSPRSIFTQVAQKAVEWCGKAIELGYPRSVMNLRELYRSDLLRREENSSLHEELTKCIQRAIRWYENKYFMTGAPSDLLEAGMIRSNMLGEKNNSMSDAEMLEFYDEQKK